MSLLCQPDPIRHDRDRIDAALESGWPFKEFALLFPDSKQALRYYATAMVAKWGRPVSSDCVCCGQAADRQMSFTWEAPITTQGHVVAYIVWFAFLLCLGHVPLGYPSMLFETTHAFCPRCARAALAKRALGKLLHSLFFALLIVLLLVAVTMLVIGAAVAFAPGDRSQGVRMLVCLLPLALPFVACVYGFRLVRHLRIPQALRQIGRRPFDLAGTHRVKS